MKISRRKFVGGVAMGVMFWSMSNLLGATQTPKKHAQKVLIIGANGRIAKIVANRLLAESSLDLRLFARNASRLKDFQNNRVEIFEGDALKKDDLLKAMQNVNIVYANLSGELGEMASNIIWAMQQAGVKRLIWVSSVGVYNEVNAYELARVSPWLGGHKQSVNIIEQSNINYTIIRPGWLSNEDSINYGITQKGEGFINPQKYISRASVADLITKICINPTLYNRASLGIHTP